MIESVIGIILLVAFISGRKIMQEYLIVASDRTSLWAKEIENDLQPEIKRVYNDRKALIQGSEHKRWLTVEDIDKLR